MGAAVLCGLFALFKVLPKDLVNRVLSLYFVALGAGAVAATVYPFVARLLPRSWRLRSFGMKGMRLPLLKASLSLSTHMLKASGVGEVADVCQRAEPHTGSTCSEQSAKGCWTGPILADGHGLAQLCMLLNPTVKSLRAATCMHSCSPCVPHACCQLVPHAQGDTADILQCAAKILVYMQEPLDWSFNVPEALSLLAAGLFCLWYHRQRHWLANNVLGLCFSIQGIEHLSVGAVQTGVILLSGLFFYDIFFVFFTPVMASPSQAPSH